MPRHLRPLLLAGLAFAVLLPAANAHASGCDPIDPSECLYPWPNDHFTRHDARTDTGRRLALTLGEMPKNAAGKPIDPSAYDRNDGFSPGTLMITRVPGLDTQAAFDANDLPTNTDPARSFDPDQRAVVIDATARSHPRQLIWAELEYPPDLVSSAAVQTLVIHPGVNLAEGHRYIVALRDLRRADGSLIPASPAFAAYRDGKATGPRARHFRSIFRTLANAGIQRSSLYLAWDFTVASERNLSERMLHIRNDAFAQLGDHDLADGKVQGTAPVATVYPDLPDSAVAAAPDLPEVGNEAQALDGETDFAPCDPSGCKAGQSDKLLRIVRGRVLVPCYLSTPDCAEGGTFLYGLDGLPRQIPGNMDAADFVCIVPRSVLTRGPARVSLYGHGLLGDASQVTGGAIQDLANEQNIVLCATDWIGMASEDLPNDIAILADLSRFDSLADRTQQGMLNFLYLGRALIHPQGLSTNPAFQAGGKPVFSTGHLYYDGGSQGGIMGGSLTAVAPDFTRAALGVPGMNYSVLLQRSVDFDEFAQVLYPAYPDQLQRPLILSLVELLWDRGEADGYAHHMTTDPLPDTPAHEVILDMAWGDHQVTNWATIVEARTIGARMRTPALQPFRTEGDAFYGIPAIASYPATGSLFEVWDVGPLRTLSGGTVKGTPPPPAGNEPNRPGVDPHGPDASEQVSARAQIGAFLQPDDQSAITPVCDESPCYLDGWDGTP
ncbi:MAG TPA: hypothetical protein VFT42_09365 [Solirubrobacteraceae bacterium]|nr:hypothetical protein [Solirubrobacteraceae bacterium]